MCGWNEFRGHLESIHEKWNKAEECIKAAEQVNHEVVLPAIKELRYAGRRIVEAINLIQKDNDEAHKRLQDAEYDCHRAHHDAVDAATSKIAEDIDIALRKLGPRAILAGHKDFLKLRKLLTHIRNRIRDSRRDREKRDCIYSDMHDDFMLLVDMYGEFQANEDIICAFAKRERRDLLLSYAVAAVSAIGAISLAINAWLS